MVHEYVRLDSENVMIPIQAYKSRMENAFFKKWDWGAIAPEVEKEALEKKLGSECGVLGRRDEWP